MDIMIRGNNKDQVGHLRNVGNENENSGIKCTVDGTDNDSQGDEDDLLAKYV